MNKSKASLRQVRLYLCIFAVLKGLILWYAIEKLFELSIGMTISEIVMIGIVAQAGKILIELPTSVIADRWNRRNILIIANLVLLASMFVMGFSHAVQTYLIGIVLWSISDGLSSGTYQAFIYDALHEASGDKKLFRKLYPRLVSFEMIAMALAGVLAGLVTKFWGLKANYFITLVPVTLAVICLLSMGEPEIERTSDIGLNVIHHTKGVFKIIVQGGIRWVSLLYLMLCGLIIIWYEYYQLVAIDVRVPTIFFGSIIGFITIGLAIGSEIAHKKPMNQRVITALWAIFAAVSLLALRSANWVVIVFGIFAVAIAGRGLQVYMEIYLHDHVESARRATLVSLLTTISYIVFFVLAVSFNELLRHFNVRLVVTLVSLPMLVLALIDLLRKLPWAGLKHDHI